MCLNNMATQACLAIQTVDATIALIDKYFCGLKTQLELPKLTFRKSANHATCCKEVKVGSGCRKRCIGLEILGVSGQGFCKSCKSRFASIIQWKGRLIGP